MKRGGFTLIEMLISVSILAIMMTFLYKSLELLDFSNKKYGKKVEQLKTARSLKQMLYLDLSLSVYGTLEIENLEKEFDNIFLQTTNSIHNRIQTYVSYVVAKKHIYRVESLKKIELPLRGDEDADVDDLGEVQVFRVYNSKTHNLVHIKISGNDDILIKIRRLNEV